MSNVRSGGSFRGSGDGRLASEQSPVDRGAQVAGWIVASLLVLAILVFAYQLDRALRDPERAALSLERAKLAVSAASRAKAAVDEEVNAEKNVAAKSAELSKAKADDIAEAKKSLEFAQLDYEKRASESRAAVADAEIALIKARTGAPPPAKYTVHWFPLVFLSLVFLIVFPLSAFAFRQREVPRLIKQSERDFRMLGGRLTTGTGTGDSPDFGDRWNWKSYAIHCSLAVFAAIVGAVIFSWESPTLLDINAQHGMQLGFLGAYAYCLNMVYRRYTTQDLQPHVYLYCAVGLLLGIIVNFAAFTAISNVTSTSATPKPEEFTGVGAGHAAIIAFSLGYFPNIAIRWFSRVTRTSLHEHPRRADAIPLMLIDGVSELHESRLQDEGIDNVQNLAAADIHDLVEKTPYSAQEIVEWVDQALLYLYVDSGEIDSFRRAGVRTVTDFRDIWGGFSIRFLAQPDGTVKRLPPPANLGDFDQRRKEIAQQLATTEQRLDCLFLATEQGPNMEHVRTYWDNVQNAATQTRNRLISQVCGRVGRALRESMRDGIDLDSSELLAQVARGLFTGVLLETEGLTAESLYGQAYLKERLGDVNEARQLYLECIKEFPDDPVAYNDIAWLDLTTPSQESDLTFARGNAAEAVHLTLKARQAAEKAVADIAAAIAKEKTAADQAAATGDAAGVAEAQRRRAVADKLTVDQTSKEAEAKKLAKELAGYRDTFALAEIRAGNPEHGAELELQSIKEWHALGRGNDPRFLDTLVEATAVFLAQGKRAEAQTLLTEIEGTGYAVAHTLERVRELRSKYELPAEPASKPEKKKT